MKKSTAAILGGLVLVGVLYLAAGLVFGVSSSSIGIIGGADGPTAVFVAGKGTGQSSVILFGLVVAIALIGLGVWFYNKKHK